MFQAVRTYAYGKPVRGATAALGIVAYAESGDLEGCSYHYEVRNAADFQVYRTYPIGPVRAELSECIADVDKAMNDACIIHSECNLSIRIVG